VRVSARHSPRTPALLLLLLVPCAAAAQEEPLTLEVAIEEALRVDEAALSAAERVRAAEARVAAARSRFLPDLTLAGSWTRSSRAGEDVAAGGGPGRDGLAGSATLTLPLLDAPGFPLHRQARLERDGARLDADDTRRVVAFGVATAFVNALSIEQVAAAAERRVGLARATLDDARDRAAAGLVSSNDVTRAELELWSAERDLTRARSALDVARVQLAALIGRPRAGALAAPAGLVGAAAAAEGDEDVLAAAARARRRDLRALELRYAAQQAFAEEPRLRLVPSLALSGGLRATAAEDLSSTRDDAFVAATLSWALWDGGLRAAERRERLALAAIADLDRSALARGTTRDVQEALVGLRAGQAITRLAQSAAAAARRNQEESTILYRQGLAPALAVADANLRLFEAEVDLARARFDLAQALLGLRRATGLDPLGRELH
jgi:outer membrane protein TolC